ncbi:MAG TPA: protein kinase [Kofleriaceae bacterium]|nr:protein kinase [Kofleriaceae bacterium]
MRGKDLSGEVLEDRYRVLERIAEGAMGAVYRGTRLNIDRAVAIKVMHASLPSAMEGRKRFEREAKLMARLEHPHCVSLIDYGLHGAKPYVVMELVRGRSLHDALVEQGKFEITRAIDVMRQVLSGLAHAHEQGIIHRDIKPANIMVTPKAPLGLHVRILDFGLARMLEASTSVSNGVAVGTPSYMAPEQCRGEELDARVDIYACGVVLFEMLTGKKPFIAGDPIAIVKKQIDQPPPHLRDIPPGGDYGALEDIVARALSKSAADRFPSAVAMAEALEAAVSGRPATAEPTMVLPVTGDPSSSASKEKTVTLAPPSASMDVPITVGSSVIQKPPKPGSSVRRQLPVSRTRWFVLAALLALGAGVAFVVVNYDDWLGAKKPTEADAAFTRVVDVPKPPDAAPPSDPATDLAKQASDLVAAGKQQAAIDSLVKARKVYPDSAILALTLGKLYMGKLWWADGIANLRDAIKLDPNVKEDDEVIKLTVRGFLMTPSYDYRLANLLIEIGPPAKPALAEAAKSHPNPPTRARAESLLRRMH